MVNNYTPNLKRGAKMSTPRAGSQNAPTVRPSFTPTGYGLFPGVPIVIGGIEASLRRFAHYDYWQDKVRQAILADARPTLLIFGMGERPMVEIARRLGNGEPVSALRDIRGTAHTVDPP